MFLFLNKLNIVYLFYNLKFNNNFIVYYNKLFIYLYYIEFYLRINYKVLTNYIKSFNILN